jgi:streptogrisin C
MTAAKTIAAALVAAACLTTTGSAAAADPATDTGSAVDTIAATYREVYPQITTAAARRAGELSDERKKLYDELTKDGGPTYGGAWFDPPTGALHVAVTTAGAAERAAALGRSLGLDVRVRVVRRSFAELERQADALRSSTTDTIGRAARGQVGIDVKTNQVVAAVPAAQQPGLVDIGRAAGVSVIVDPGIPAEEDACTTRTACTSEIRAGSVLWRGNSGSSVCSAGFTASQPFTGRFVMTAGHCSDGNNVNWGTSTQLIGPMWASYNSGNIDVALISVTNPLYTNQPGGDMFKAFDVDDVAPTVSYIVAGETVCLSANFTQPSQASNNCGVITTNSDPNHHGMVGVDGEDACHGDSGGGWYWRVNGFRTAYGIHHASSPDTCHSTDEDFDYSWFTAIAIADILDPLLTVEEK